MHMCAHKDTSQVAASLFKVAKDLRFLPSHLPLQCALQVAASLFKVANDLRFPSIPLPP